MNEKIKNILSNWKYPIFFIILFVFILPIGALFLDGESITIVVVIFILAFAAYAGYDEVKKHSKNKGGRKK